MTGYRPALKARLFAAIDLSILWDKTGGQVTVYATITDATLTALTDLLDPGQDGYHDTAAPLPASDNALWGIAAAPYYRSGATTMGAARLLHAAAVTLVPGRQADRP